jgi:hypothetical protein
VRIKSLILVAVLLLLGAVVHGYGEKETSGSGSGKSFLYTASKVGIPIFKASIKIENGFSDQGRSLCRIQAHVRSLPYIELFFRMDNRFTSTADAETLSPVRYVKEIDQEGLLVERKNYLQTLTFDSSQKKVVVEKRGERERQEIPLPGETYDPLSMFARCYLKEEIRPGQELRMSIYDGVKLRQMVFHSKKGRVKSKRDGEVDAVCLESTTSFSAFGDKEGMIRIWYSSDGEKTPISIELDLPVGSVRFDLDAVEET